MQKTTFKQQIYRLLIPFFLILAVMIAFFSLMLLSINSRYEKAMQSAVIAADFNKLKDSKIPGENLGVDVALPSAEIVKDLCWPSDGAKSINVRHIWFKTNATKQTLTIKVDKNRRLLLKSISVVPVFTDL